MAINPAFQVHMLNGQGLTAANDLAKAFSDLLTKVEELVPASRERSLVVTKLQEASYWAKRGVAMLPANQLEE